MVDQTKTTSDMWQFAELWERELPGADDGVFMAIGSVLRLAAMLENEFRTYTQTELGMGPGDMRVLLALRRAGPPYGLRPTDLFQALLITSGAVTKQVERLTRRGLVDRIPEPNRKGSWLVHLTDDGRTLTDVALKAIHSQLRFSGAFRSLSAEEGRKGNHFLGRMIARYEVLASGAGVLP